MLEVEFHGGTQSMTSSTVSPLKHAAFQVLAASAAGFLEVILLHPLDVVKTRIQLQTQADYTGVVDCFVKMYRQEGFGAYWKGVLPPIISDTPKRALKFVVYEHAKPFYQFGAPQPNALSYSLAGCTAGSVEAFLITPFELIKVMQQANRQNYLNTYAVARNVVRSDGLLGLYKGFTATMLRNGCFHFVYFGFYYGMRDFLPPTEDHTLEFMRKLITAFLAGSMGVVVITPIDVVKSRIQGPQPVKGETKYRGSFQSIGLVYREEGFRGLFKGWQPKIMRVGPGGTILMLGYEYVYEYLLTNYS